MPRKDRWGYLNPDTRNWSIYNERLVKRGEFYLSLDFINQWDELIAVMNAGKRGRPFQYPEHFIAWMACIHVFLQLPYRQMEGFARKLTEFIPGLRAADYTTLFRRIQRLDLSLSVTPDILAGDGSSAARGARTSGSTSPSFLRGTVGGECVTTSPSRRRASLPPVLAGEAHSLLRRKDLGEDPADGAPHAPAPHGCSSQGTA